MSETVFIDLDAADGLLLEYAKVRSALDAARRSLSSPWAQAVLQVGHAGTSAPDLLRGIDLLMCSARADVAWRVEFIKARENSPIDAGRIETTVPERHSVLRRLSTSHIIGALRTSEDSQRIVLYLDELAVRGSGDRGIAVEVLDALGREGVERLLALIAANAPIRDPEQFSAPFGYDVLPEIENPVDPDEMLLPLDLLVSFAVSEKPSMVAELLVGDRPEDVLRSAMLLKWASYPPAVLAEVFVAHQQLLADVEDSRWQYSMLLDNIDPSSLQSSSWVTQFGAPMIELLADVSVDPADATEFVTTPGVIELLSRPPAAVLEVAGQPFVEIWDHSVALILTQLLVRIDELANRVPDRAIAGRAIDELAAILDSSYQVLVGLRDAVGDTLLGGEAVKNAAAILTALHFDRIGPAGWPINGHAKEFFGWIASSPAALQTLVGGLAGFYESVMPDLVASFADPAGLGDAMVDRSILQLEPMAFVLSLVALGLDQAKLEEKDLLALKLVFEFAWNEAIGKLPLGKLGTNALGRLAKIILGLGLDTLHDKAAGQLLPDRVAGEITIDSILSDFFIPHEALPLPGGGETQEIVPLQISLFNQVLQFAPEAVVELPELEPYLVDGSLRPPPIDSAQYSQFALVFNKVQMRDIDAVVAYLAMWESLSAWAQRSVAEVRTATSS
ncbi:MAG: hypothetical protein V3V01_14870 [Acidimicrobiales bacterium]